MDDLKSQLQALYGQAHIPDGVLSLIGKLTTGQLSRYLRLANLLRTSLNQYTMFNRFFNDHGLGHSYRITRDLARLLSQGQLEEVTAGEAFILVCAAFCHDIGMAINRKIQVADPADDRTKEPWFKDIGVLVSPHKWLSRSAVTIRDDELIRKWHHILSWNFVIEHYRRLELTRAEARLIASVCRYHRRKENIEDLPEDELLRSDNQNFLIHTKKTAAFFRLADALDIERDRADEFQLEYVMNLPEENQIHWRVCQQIETWVLRPEEILLVAIYDYQSDIDLLNWKVDDLFSEYERIRKVLRTDPYRLTFEDIVCEARSIYGRTVHRISGYENMMRLAKQYGQQRLQIQAGFIPQLADTWITEISEQRDAKVTRSITIKLPRQPEAPLYREHQISCYDTPMEWDWNVHIKAYDEAGELKVEPTEDRPNYKVFRILLPSDIQVNTPYTYTYRLYWDKFFPKSSESFAVLNYAEHLYMELRVPLQEQPNKTYCTERSPVPDSKCSVAKARPDKEEKDLTKGQKVYIFELLNAKRGVEYSIHWEY